SASRWSGTSTSIASRCPIAASQISQLRHDPGQQQQNVGLAIAVLQKPQIFPFGPGKISAGMMGGRAPEERKQQSRRLFALAGRHDFPRSPSTDVEMRNIRRSICCRNGYAWRHSKVTATVAKSVTSQKSQSAAFEASAQPHAESI